MSDEAKEEFDEEESADPFDGDSPDESSIEDAEDGEIFDGDEDVADDDDFADDEVPAAATNEDDDDDEVEADLTDILQERITAEDDAESEEKTEPKKEDGEAVNVVAKQEDEIHCPSCFLLVSQAAIDKDGECPHCGAPV